MLCSVNGRINYAKAGRDETEEAGSVVFVGRNNELEILRRFSSDPSGSRLTAIYGRRRVGKTRLVQEAYSGFPLIHFEGLEGAGTRSQKNHFLKTLYRHSKMEAHRLAAPSDWEDLLILLAEYVAHKRCVVFFDEFQWMAAGRNDLIGKLKFVWDNYFTKAGPVHLILCGSISSFLVKKVIASRALYGRVDDVIALEPLLLHEARSGFLGSRSAREVLEYYLVVGGVPTYLELFDVRRSARLNIGDLCFKPHSYLLEEFDRLFVSHFGTVPHYRPIIQFLAGRGFATREEVAKHIGLTSGGRISTYLEDLDMAGFIEGYGPLHNPGSTHLRRYRIADPYLRFYFRFIHPLRRRIARTPEGIPLHEALAEKRYDIFLGLAFEHFCHRHAHLIAKKLGFSAVAYDCGSWYRRGDLSTGAQVDLLFKRADNVMTLCEVKFRDRVGKEVIKDVEKKTAALAPLRKKYAVETVLITAVPPTQDLINEGYFSTILTTDDLVSG